jgi:hypothetical protein
MKAKRNWLRKFWTYLSKKLRLKFSKELNKKYYLSIKEIPIYNWVRIFQDREYNYAMRDPKGKLDDRFQDVLFKLQDHYTEVFGVDDNYLEYIREMVSIELLYLEMAINDDRSLKLRIEVAEKEFDEKFRPKIKADFQQVIMAIERDRGFKVNQREETVYEVISYAKSIQERLKNAKRRVPE